MQLRGKLNEAITSGAVKYSKEQLDITIESPI